MRKVSVSVFSFVISVVCFAVVVFSVAISVALALPLFPGYAVLDVSPRAKLCDISTNFVPLHLYVRSVSTDTYILPSSPVISVVCAASL